MPRILHILVRKTEQNITVNLCILVLISDFTASFQSTFGWNILYASFSCVSTRLVHIYVLKVLNVLKYNTSIFNKKEVEERRKKLKDTFKEGEIKYRK